MRKKWVGIFAALAVAAMLIPAIPFFLPKGTPPSPAPAPAVPRAASLSGHQEKMRKLADVNQDMKATAFLCVTECSKDFKNLLNTSAATDQAKQLKLKSLMDGHHHMQQLTWIAGERKLSKGSLPDTSNGLAQTYAAEGAKRVKAGQKYESPAFTDNKGSRYIVLGVPKENHKGVGIVGVIRQDIVTQVERHQKRNLRLVPYPAEGRYRVESVKPNSMEDTTVKTGEDNGNASHYHTREVVVHFKTDPSNSEMDKIQKHIHAVSVNHIGDVYIFRSSDVDAEDMMNYFRKTWKTEYVEPHYLYMTNAAAADSFTPNDPLYSQYQWNLPSIEAEKGWKSTKGSDRVIVAVIDTGVQADHPDLQGKLLKGTNFVNPDAAPDDDVGHGTHVSGIIGADVNNGEGVAGLSWYNKILPVKVLDSTGAGSTYSVAQGIIWATDHGAKVINMSLGNYAEADFLHDAIKYAYERDVVLIAASGNDNTDRPGYPAAYPEVFAVAATDAHHQKASFSNYGNYIDVAAPGDSIASTYPGGQYAALSGTSMASPHVAALAGLIRSLNPALTNEQVMDVMRQSAVDIGNDGKDDYYGYGEIDVAKALKLASDYTTTLLDYPSEVKRRLEAIKQQYDGETL
ncbi:S8 family peptidase [Paenibacillus protaetiae]|uniref:Peptidase S8 n=1 Tax=Paenibacillus protaetiae TaxID=2509456 RepID=A0A4P6EZY2_9BACL|nr:S8 family peptidase [Paenibacillus protaetiae]QAY66287.1 peptidase S8 [Paenibacillus protaetiae]